MTYIFYKAPCLTGSSYLYVIKKYKLKFIRNMKYNQIIGIGFKQFAYILRKKYSNYSFTW
jgi:hypothetical protein